MEQQIAESELILNKEGRIYHLNLKPDELADTVITVGDPARVAEVSRYFDEIEFTTEHREFIFHTGYLNKRRLTVMSTGMGTPNIDIVLNELDALANIDFETRTIKPTIKSLKIIRFGTAGCFQSDVPVGSVVLTDFSVGFDNLLWFYPFTMSDIELKLQQSLINQFNQQLPVQPYIFEGDQQLRQQLQSNCIVGMTATCPGFYGPQHRILRSPPVMTDFMDQLTEWRPGQSKCLNFEMETSAIYGMASLLGHKACSLSTILANRVTGEFDSHPGKSVDNMIKNSLELLTTV